MKDIYDVIILGGGPAGLTAAIYTGRYNMKTLVVANSFGGTANLAGEVENWPGFIGSGADLMNNFKEQAEKFGAEFLVADVQSAKKDGAVFVLQHGEGTVRGKSLIVALGTENRKLDIPGEKEFLGKGVSYCATCDGNFFRGKNVAVVGGADSAAKAALYLADICEKVYVVYRRHEMRCEPVSLSKIKKNKKIEIRYFSNPTDIIGDKVVEGLKILTDDPDKKPEEVELKVNGVFVEIGATAASDVVAGLGLKMEKGYVVVDKNKKTNAEGVFGAGDVTNGVFRQIVTAASDGAVAAKMAHEFLLKK